MANINRFGLQVASIAGFPIDATVTETHDLESEVTEYPTEKGSDITDHVRNKPIHS